MDELEPLLPEDEQEPPIEEHTFDMVLAKASTKPLLVETPEPTSEEIETAFSQWLGMPPAYRVEKNATELALRIGCKPQQVTLLQKQTYAEWLMILPGERFPQTQNGLAELLGVDTGTPTRWARHNDFIKEAKVAFRARLLRDAAAVAENLSALAQSRMADASTIKLYGELTFGKDDKPGVNVKVEQNTLTQTNVYGDKRGPDASVIEAEFVVSSDSIPAFEPDPEDEGDKT